MRRVWGSTGPGQAGGGSQVSQGLWRPRRRAHSEEPDPGVVCSSSLLCCGIVGIGHWRVAAREVGLAAAPVHVPKGPVSEGSGSASERVQHSEVEASASWHGGQGHGPPAVRPSWRREQRGGPRERDGHYSARGSRPPHCSWLAALQHHGAAKDAAEQGWGGGRSLQAQPPTLHLPASSVAPQLGGRPRLAGLQLGRRASRCGSDAQPRGRGVGIGIPGDGHWLGLLASEGEANLQGVQGRPALTGLQGESTSTPRQRSTHAHIGRVAARGNDANAAVIHIPGLCRGGAAGG